ncbi:MAG: hypothetical protein ABJB11_12705 [Ferruginibacter sp.]
MTDQFLKIRQLGLIVGLLLFFTTKGQAQYKTYSLSPTGDTLNAVDNKGLKQGKWVIKVAPLRGEPGYEEEGIFKNDKKDGVWRRYNTTGDILAIENYRFGGKDGMQEYFGFLGDLQRQEGWRAYNPDAPYDTIPIYGTGSNEILRYQIVKAEQYSVPNGEWKYYDATGRVTRYEKYDRGRLLKDEQEKVEATAVAKTEADKPKEKVKTKEILEYEKKYSKKKRNQLERVGKTGL